jgi:hypothetical protein
MGAVPVDDGRGVADCAGRWPTDELSAGDGMRSLRDIASDLRNSAPCVVGGHSAPCVDCSLMIEAAEALEMIDTMNGVKLRRGVPS